MDDIRACGKFRVCPSGCSMEAKWFAIKLEDAMEWGRRFYGGQEFYVVTASMPDEIAKQMHYDQNLDGIGNAICIEEDFFSEIQVIKVLGIKRK